MNTLWHSLPLIRGTLSGKVSVLSIYQIHVKIQYRQKKIRRFGTIAYFGSNILSNFKDLIRFQLLMTQSVDAKGALFSRKFKKQSLLYYICIFVIEFTSYTQLVVLKIFKKLNALPRHSQKVVPYCVCDPRLSS